MIGFPVMMWFVASTLLVMAASPALPGTRPAGTPGSYVSLEALRHYSLAGLLDERGDTPGAITEYSRALSLDPDSPQIAIHLSDLTARQGDAARSLEFADRALAASPGNARAEWLRGSALFNLGRNDEALDAMSAAVHADTLRADYALSLARVAEQLDRLDIVRDAYRRVVDLDEEDAEAWFQLAAAEARLARFEEADSALARSIQLNPSRPGLFFLQGWIEESLGHAAAAIELYRNHLRIHTTDQVTRRRLVNLLVGAKRYSEAYKESQTVSRSREGDLDSQFIEADLALFAGQVAEGHAILERLRRAHAEDVDVQGRIVGVLARHQRANEGAELAEIWAARHPGQYQGAMLAGRANALAEKIPAALAYARHAVALAPDSLETHVLLARIDQGAKRWSEAESVWVQVLKAFPESGRAALDLAYCREQMGDLDGAERAVRDLLKREPENPSALNSLGYLFADHNRNLEEAERLIRRALEHDPGNGAFLDSMGWVYYRLGRLAEARHELERAVVLTGGDAVVREHLGDVYKELRLNDLAREQYRLSLAGDRNNERVKAKLIGVR